MQTTEKPRIKSEDAVNRRFGRVHENPCADRTTITCTLWECQRLNKCQKQ